MNAPERQNFPCHVHVMIGVPTETPKKGDAFS